MNIYFTFSILITTAIILAYLNHRLIKMQTTSAIMVGALVLSLILLGLNKLGLSHLEAHVETFVAHLHFHNLLINGMLSFLLFAGALTIDWETFKNQRLEIFTLASVSTIASAFLVGITSYLLFNAFHINLPFKYCMLFGALISPTDPIAVLSMVTEIHAPKKLEVIIAGESLFNDGVGIVIFITLYQFAFSNQPPTIHGTIILFIQQVIGGITYGAILGWLGTLLIRSVDDHKLRILITIGIVTGGYTLAQFLQISGPLAMVVAGMLVGNTCRKALPTDDSYKIIEGFWEIIDEILNAFLFLLIGFEILVMSHYFHQVLLCLLAIPLVLIIRAITVALPMNFFKRTRSYPPQTINILIWGGLRGGLAVALALSLPLNHYRDLILTMTYTIVVFAIVIQSTTIKGLVKRSMENKS